MATIYLHIGTMKTATSALQSFLKKHTQELADNRALYPITTSIDKNVNGRFWEFRKKNDKEEQAQKRKEAYAVLRQAIKEYDKIIVSLESIWNIEVKKEKFWNTVLRFCDKRGVDLKIVVYLRNQIDYAQSFYVQKIKARGYDKNFEEAIDDDTIASGNYDYYEILESIAERIGKENIILRVFEPEQLVNGNIVEDFATALGMSFSPELYDEAKKITNYSLEGDYIEAKLRINRDPQYASLEPKLTSAIRKMNERDIEACRPPKTQLASSEFLKSFMSRYEEGNAKIAREYLGREDGVLFKKEFKELPLYNPNEEHVNAIIDEAVRIAKEDMNADK